MPNYMYSIEIKRNAPDTAHAMTGILVIISTHSSPNSGHLLHTTGREGNSGEFHEPSLHGLCYMQVESCNMSSVNSAVCNQHLD